MIQIVLPKEYALQLMNAYKLGGLGYDIKGSMFFIEKMGLSQIIRFVNDTKCHDDIDVQQDIYVMFKSWNMAHLGLGF